MTYQPRHSRHPGRPIVNTTTQLVGNARTQSQARTHSLIRGRFRPFLQVPYLSASRGGRLKKRPGKEGLDLAGLAAADDSGGLETGTKKNIDCRGLGLSNVILTLHVPILCCTCLPLSLPLPHRFFVHPSLPQPLHHHHTRRQATASSTEPGPGYLVEAVAL